jgi:hypothetical protein
MRSHGHTLIDTHGVGKTSSLMSGIVALDILCRARNIQTPYARAGAECGPRREPHDRRECHRTAPRIQALVPLMPAGSSIVNVCSVAALFGHVAAAHTAGKWSLRGLSCNTSLERVTTRDRSAKAVAFGGPSAV